MRLSVIGLLAIVAAGPAATSAFAQATTTTAPATQDKAISERIAKRIADEPGLKADAVKVKVEHGVVTLSGLVANAADRARAGQLANVEGVTRVENNLKTREGAKESAKGTAGTVGEKTKDGAGKVADKTKEGLSKTGEKITDTWIHGRVNAKFVNEDLLHDSNIDVDVKDHVVTLNGTVLSAAGRRRAVEIAKSVEGVDRVVDKLTIGPKK